MENKGKRLEVFQTDRIRDLVNLVNEKGVQKEDIVEIIPEPRTHEFILLYYI